MYSCVVVPKILEKIPESVRLNMTRGTRDAYQEWDMQQMIDSFRKELELRERASQFFGKNKGVVTEKQFGKSGGQTTASVLFSKKSEGWKGNCAFFMGNHSHSNCRKVLSVQDHKALFRKYARCFICANKGHLARDCRSNRSCEHCGGRHHISICEGQGLRAREAEGRSITVEPSVQSKGEAVVSMFGAGVNNHVGVGGSVALQTAKGIIREKRDLKVRVLFDCGAHRSFVMKTTKDIAGLNVIRKESVTITTFGQTEGRPQLMEVVEVNLSPVGRGEIVKIQAYVVPDISQVRNEHVEIVKTDYPHLRDIWFSDVSKEEEILSIDVLIGSDLPLVFSRGGNNTGGGSP